MTIRRLPKAAERGKKWTMLTAYDAPTAEILESEGVDLILVGDSVGMVLLGYDSTREVTMDEMIHHAKAVRRGAPKSFIIGDMPLKGIEKGPAQALRSAKRFIREAGCDAVKVEWGKNSIEITDLLVHHRIPVMGHVGLTPQNPKIGFKVQGQTAGSAIEIFETAKMFEKHKVFSLLLECLPSPVARAITEHVKVPVIGIGAGPDCDGQVLVYHDLVGAFKKFHPRFVKNYADIDKSMRNAVRKYIRDVREKNFPKKMHSFSMKKNELLDFKRVLGTRKNG